MFTDNVPSLCNDFPFSSWAQLDICHTIAASDGCSQLACGNSHGFATARWINVPVIQGPGASDNTGHIDKWIDSSALFRADDLHPESNNAGNALDIAEPIQLFFGCSEPNATTSMPACSLASHLFEFWIECVAAVMYLRKAVVANNAGALPGSMPGGSGSQVSFFEQNAIVPSLQCQVVQQPNTHHSPANDYYSRM